VPLFLELAEVLDLHHESIVRYGGDPSIRDIGLLKSALAQPSATFGGEFLNPDLTAMAASLLFSLVSNHPFVDGNKRTGAAAARVFLLMNGSSFEPTNDEYAELVLAVATGAINKDAVTEFFREHTV
jgi:death-on-curing protein